MNIRLSIIIPNYNGAEFLGPCIDSVLTQVTDACEVILVDDGSTDTSVNLIRDDFHLAISSGNLKLICIQNSGPGQARNIGMKAACGEYIAFIDSDDYILPNYIEDIFKILDNHPTDIIQFNAMRFSEGLSNMRVLLRCHTSDEGQYNLSDVREEIFGIGRWFPCTRIYRKMLLNNHPFPSDRSFYEDLATIPYLFMNEASIYLCDGPLYAYRDNPMGTTRNHKPDHAQTLLVLFRRASALPASIARDLMRVQIARSIVFFALELRLPDIPLGDLRRQIRCLKNKPALIAHLGRADRFFLRFPLLYTVLDWARKYF